jgi:hypothetical protein
MLDVVRHHYTVSLSNQVGQLRSMGTATQDEKCHEEQTRSTDRGRAERHTNELLLRGTIQPLGMCPESSV